MDHFKNFFVEHEGNMYETSGDKDTPPPPPHTHTHTHTTHTHTHTVASYIIFQIERNETIRR